MLENILTLEMAGTVLSLAYVILLTFNTVWAWPCGILGSAIMGYTFVTADAPLYMESVSYTVYVLMGFYGLWYWLKSRKTQSKQNEVASAPIVEWTLLSHVSIVVGGALLATAIAQLLAYTDEARPLFDSFTTVFALIGTWMQARKVLSSWLYWLVINGASIYLYLSTGFHEYAVLSGIFTVLSITGYLQWRKVYAAQPV